MTLPERLDDLAHMTGFPQFSARFAARTQHGLHLRWTPVIAVALATAGFVTAVTAPPPGQTLGFALLSVAQAIGLGLSLLGPVKPFGTLTGVDERDRQLRRDSYLATFMAISGISILALIALAGFALVGRWDRESVIVSLPALAFYLLCLLVTVPTLYASWATRPIEEDE